MENKYLEKLIAGWKKGFPQKKTVPIKLDVSQKKCYFIFHTNYGRMFGSRVLLE